jgi:inner membrane transporter RhtA
MSSIRTAPAIALPPTAPPTVPAAPVRDRVPPHAYFAISAVFHYLGPAFAVLLFVHVDPLGVAWLRIAGAAAVFALWCRPWRWAGRLPWAQWRLLLGLGVVLAAMNTTFYLAVDRLPLATVGAVEFLGVVGLAAAGVRSRRNLAALALVVGGVAVLTDAKLAGEPLGFVFAFANCALFVGYVVLGHRIAQRSQSGPGEITGIDQLGIAMLIAAVAATPLGLGAATPAFGDAGLLLAGLGVAVCSSVIPYVADQLAMARLPRSTFALMLALLPVFAVVIGAVVLGQLPTPAELLGVAVVGVGVAAHQVPTPKEER